MDAASHRLRAELGREPSAEETADALGLTESESQELARDLHTVLRLTDGAIDIHLEDAHVSAAAYQDQSHPDKALESEQARRILHKAMEELPERDRQILSLCYFRGQSMRDIGQRLGIHTTRVFQLRRRALEALGARLRAEGICSAVEVGSHCLAED
jgi:RNA polymerase sigma factor for flagellar operon FliA